MNAAAAAEFKTGFGTTGLNGFAIGQPFADADSIYNPYGTYNNWAAKVPAPLSGTSFKWSMNHLSSVVPAATHHHHHAQVSPVNCFNSAATSVAGSHVSGMSVSVGQSDGHGLSRAYSTSMLPGMGSSLGVTGSPVGASGAGCYGAPAAPHPYGPSVYSTSHHKSPTDPPDAVMSSSIAALRLKAKQHTSSGYGSSGSFSTGGANTATTGGSISPVSSRASSGGGGLSACQYALSTGTNNPHSPGPEHGNVAARAQV